MPIGVPEEVGASDLEAGHGLCVGSGLFTHESVVAEVGSCFRPGKSLERDTQDRWAARQRGPYPRW